MSRTKNTADNGAVSGDVLPPTPRINLASPEYIRQEMARVYREARGKLIDTNEASKLIYMLSQIAKAYELSMIEQRISDLEAATQTRSLK